MSGKGPTTFGRLNQLYPVILLAILGGSLALSHGHYNLNLLIILSFGFFYLPFYLRQNNLNLTKVLFENSSTILTALFSLVLSQGLHLIYAKPSLMTHIFQGLYGVLGLIGVSLVVFRPSQKVKNIWSYSIVGLGVILLLLIPTLSPSPVIDVWIYQQKASEALINLTNPYELVLPHLYGDEIGSTYGYPYWPMNLYLTTVGKWLLSDIRYSAIFAQVVMIAHWLWKKKSLKTLALWMVFPVQFFVLEQAWLEGLMLPLIYFHLYSLKERNLWQGALFLSMILAMKQTMVFYGILTWIYMVKKEDRKASLEYTLISIGGAILLFLPWIVWNPMAFIQETVLDVLSLKARADAMSWSSFLLQKFFNPFPTFIYIGLVLGVFLWSAKKVRDVSSLLLMNIAVYGTVFLFGKQAFCNYYYLIGFILILFINELNVREKSHLNP